jgi:hypothetical protein
MEIRRQRQAAGPGSNQYQVTGPLVVIDKAAASEIAGAIQAMVTAQEFTAEAAEIASDRINQFDDKVVGEFSERDLLKIFADPAFQILLRKTQLHAAATGEDSDHDLLTKLLAERAQEPSKPMHMVVTRAVEVVEQIDPVALRGMTFLWFASAIGPSLADPKLGLAAIDNLVSKLADGEFPVGTGWLQRLDIMNCVHYRPPGLQSLLKWHDILLATRQGYACEGMLAADADAMRVRLNRVVPSLGSLVVEHAFLPDRFRINALSSTVLMESLDLPLQALRQAKGQIPQETLSQFGSQQPLETLGVKEELEAVLTEARLDTVNAEAKANMLKHVEAELPNLQNMRSWWDSLTGVVEITPVGIAIAYSNAKRFDQLLGLGSLPEMIGSA